MAIDKYLNQLISDKQALVDNLVEKGIEASSDETFTSLVPKVSDIESGSGKYSPKHISFYGDIRTDISEDLINLDTSNMNYMNHMFRECRSLKSLDLSGFNTSNAINMQSMFENCVQLTSLDLTSFDTSNVQYMSDMFKGIQRLNTLNLSSFNTINVSSISGMFQNCSGLTEVNISNLNLSKVYSISSLFIGCSKLVTLNMNNVDMSGINSFGNTNFNSCTNLENLTFSKNLGKGYKIRTTNNNYMCTVSLSWSTLLTHDSLMSVINNLYDLNLTYDVVNGGTLYTQQLILGADNLAKLTADEISIATNKGWTVS